MWGRIHPAAAESYPEKNEAKQDPSHASGEREWISPSHSDFEDGILLYVSQVPWMSNDEMASTRHLCLEENRTRTLRTRL